MKPFMDADFLLTNPVSRQLYREAADAMPVYDYHSHLSSQSIAQNERYENLTHLLLSRDHYKWRLLLTAGVAEDKIRGNASDWEKFLSFARVLQGAVGNPLYHWTHLELQRLFDIHEPLNEQTARRIWDMCNEKLRGDDFRAQAIINRYRVHSLFTCEDALSDLAPCLTLQNAPEFKPRLKPIFCPDQAVLIHQNGFSDYISKLSSKTSIPIKSTADLLRALEQRMDYFHAMGCRTADHMLDPVPRCHPDEEAADKALRAAMAGEPLKRKQVDSFESLMYIRLGLLYARRNWVQQYHIGSLRNTNQRMYAMYGTNVGFDSVSDQAIADNLSQLLDAQNRSMSLPKTILFGINPAHNYVLGSMIGNYQQSEVEGKMQMGPPWRFQNHRDGISEYLRGLSNLSLLSCSIGMTADCRSIASFSRHEYFRRILCETIGVWVEFGEYPTDMNYLKGMVRNICYHNALGYFG